MTRRARAGRAVRWLGLALLAWIGLVPLVLAAEAPRTEGRESASAAQVSPDVANLLSRMAQAVRSLDYEGTFVYLHEDRLEAMSLQHRVDQGRIQERIISLSGPVRAVVRGEERVMCVLPDGHPISVERNGRVRFLDTEGIDPGALLDHYRVERLGAARIAGRDTDVVGIVPRDTLRYGYRFHIDRKTGLPLKSDLIDQDQKPLEQLMFTSIALHPSDGSAPEEEGSVRSAPAASPVTRWRFDAAPAGFELVMHDEMRQPDGSVIEHFMFTDRLSAYSVYIDQDSDDGLDGLASIGAVHAAGRKIDGYQLIAVGEVPMRTVQAAVAGARLAPQGASRAR